MVDLVRRISGAALDLSNQPDLLNDEWLVTNGLGGYASGTVAGMCRRRYHGLLIAALPAPLGRIVMLSHLSQQLELPDGTVIEIGGPPTALSDADPPGGHHLSDFYLELGLPVWRYQVGDVVIERRIIMPHLQNTVHVSYRLVAGEGPVHLTLRPSMGFRALEAPVSEVGTLPYTVHISEDRYEIAGDRDPWRLRMTLYGRDPEFTADGGSRQEAFYGVEAARGYDARGILWSPGRFGADLVSGRDVTLVGSTESWETIFALLPEEASRAELHRRRGLLEAAACEARTTTAQELVLAADQFIITPAGRVEDVARAHAAGDEVRTVIAGYHWFTDWGRDTMISLEGLTLCTGRHNEAGYILRMFAHYIRDGLIPNMFPEGENGGLYHTADATLWFFHAINRYVQATGDRATLRLLLPQLRDIVDWHMHGTRFGIGVDAVDGLLRQGQEGYQLTWMDAKVGDWVVTPRRGKAVEINALWFNALRLLEGWVREEVGDEAAKPLATQAKRVHKAFNQRFWYAEGSYLYDVVDGEDGDDPSCRPNQLFAISLDHPVLDQERWKPVLEVVRERLLTPVGLRSLAPGSRDYKSRYDGDLRARDAAYHQGTVWGWLIGPYVDAALRVDPGRKDELMELLQGFVDQLGQACIGSISEIFDAESPFTPRGCVAQAWSVAEALRCWQKVAAPEERSSSSE